MKGRVAAALALLVLSACAAGCSIRTEKAPGAPCDLFEPCGSPLVCVNESCATICTFVGDCDPGFICVEKVCLPRCETSEDCQDQRCSESEALGGKYCGVSASPICGDDEDCPVGWACSRSGPSGTCVETCARDSDCPPDEACFEESNFGRCRFGERPGDFDTEDTPDAGQDMDVPANNPVIDRACANRPDDWCEDQFGRNQVCFQGRCTIAPRTIVVFDRSEGSACNATLDGLISGGSDIVSVSDPSESVLWASVVDIVEGPGARTDAGVTTEPRAVCLPPNEIVSVGCGGWITLTTRDPLLEGSLVTVAEYDAMCGDESEDRYQLLACTDERAVTLARDLTSCTALLGEAEGTNLFVVDY